MSDDAVARLVELLKSAQEAHHEAFVEQGGEDPEWPIWYADFSLKGLRQQLSADFSKSELVYLLLTASHEHSIRAPGMSWPAFVARFLHDRYRTH
ncbi:MAG: hypothetical protein ACLFWD_03680 [Anaerolineales bacterium]